MFGDALFGSLRFGDASPPTGVISGGGISSAEQFGNSSLVQIISGPGVSDQSGVGSNGILTSHTYINLAEIEGLTGEGRFGDFLFGGRIDAAPQRGVPSAEAFGVGNLQTVITDTSIPSAEAFGNSVLLPTEYIVGTGIPSAQAFGASRIQFTIADVSIPSLEVIGVGSIGRVTNKPAGRIHHVRGTVAKVVHEDHPEGEIARYTRYVVTVGKAAEPSVVQRFFHAPEIRAKSITRADHVRGNIVESPKPVAVVAHAAGPFATIIKARHIRTRMAKVDKQTATIAESEKPKVAAVVEF